MKFVKKITALFLALTMVMAMGITASAYTISTSDTHTYTVYQVLTGDLSDGVLSNINAGQNFKTSETEEAKIKAAAQAAAEALAKLSSNQQSTADAVAEYVNFESDAYGKVTSASSLTDVPAGYYLIKDTTTNLATGDSYSTYIVKVVGDVTITPKKGTVEFEKKVQDINDSKDAAAGSLQDSADYDIGDSVPFTLTGTLPENYGSYTKYYYQFEDEMEVGLTYNNDAKVYAVNGQEETEIPDSNYTYATKASVGDGYNTGFTITFNDLKTIKDITINKDTKIVVRYTSTLNESAVLGNQGNVNRAKLHYSSNPNKGGEGDKGETEWDNVIVFTYQVIVDKVDEKKEPLAGAEFTLYKFERDDNSQKTYNGIKGDWVASKTATLNEAKTEFTFKGLDDGYYKLVETTTPKGYNTVDDIEFEVTATHTITWNGEVRTTILTSLNGDNLGTGVVSTGTITGEVENRKGSTLPETGGMGTTVLYIAGIAMIVAAGIVVIARKRNA